ncbi:MAG TPA: Mrp/NBP35 family ATP-binding protein [Rhodothermales bacterium]|nr:Mrp/NBP35 family ATP-binding protein [Rhodothermales bacterium]HRR08261.1 Mrp/NBP35 family ATP-binding protein [Rhodothermales bacterium]
MPVITTESVLKALSTVIEPDLHRDLVSLNMIKNVQVSGHHISFSVELTTPACPLKELIERDCRQALYRHFGDEVVVEITMTADVSRGNRLMETNVLPEVRNIVAVASGKGGVGKSTVAANLAVALAQTGARVGLVDTDIYGPSVPTMFGATEVRPRVNADRKIIPIEQYGVKLLSMGFLVDPDQAAIWRGPMVTSAVQQFIRDAEWGALDYLLLDLPPGTGDIQLTLVQTVPITGAVIVSTPQEVALADARRGVAMFQKVNVPVLGFVENMAYFTPPDLPDRKYYLFGEGGAKRLAAKMQVPLLGEIPIEQIVRESGDDGAPVVMSHPGSLSAAAFRYAAEETARVIAVLNAENGNEAPIFEIEA